jgi:hypothetical protein
VSRNKTPQITLDGLVNTLGLSVHLGVIGGAHAKLRAHGTEDALPEFAGEHWVMVQHQGLGHAMEAIDRIHKKISHLARRVWVSERTKVSVLGKFVDNDQDAVELTGLWQPIDKIHSCHLPWARWNGQRL